MSAAPRQIGMNVVRARLDELGMTRAELDEQHRQGALAACTWVSRWVQGVSTIK
jgi:hypothetical protein